MNDDQNRLTPPATSPTAHLSDNEIVELELTPHTQKHLGDCAWCRRQRESISQDDRVELDLLLDELDQHSPTSEASRVAAGWSLPSKLATYLAASSQEFPEVAAGQLWRLSWRTHQVLAVVVSQSSWWTRVAPVTTDVALADEYTLLTDPETTSLNYETATFMRASASVPTFTLAQYLGDIGPIGGLDASEALRTLDIAMLDGERSADIPTGPPLNESDWDRQEFLDSLHESMKWFESASLSVLEESDLIVGTSAATGGPLADVVDLLNTTKDLPSLVEATGIAPGRLVNFKSGRETPRGVELDALSSYFGSEIDGSHPDNKRTAALELISEPSNRSLWLTAAESDTDETELSPRRFLADLLQTPIAARTVSGGKNSPPANASVEDWKRVLRDQIAHRHRSNS